MKNLTLYSLIIGILWSMPVKAQQITLNGQVSIHNSKHQTGTIKYVPNAYVTADFATPSNTDATGHFSLTFQSVTKGDRVELSVEKEAYEVVNERALMDVVLGRTAPLKVYLAPKGQLAQAQTELYDISVAALTAKHDALIAELRKGGEASQAVIEQLEQQLNREIEHRFEAEDLLNEQLEATKKRLPETVKKLAMVNLDVASVAYQKAYEYYKAGEIEQALKVLDEADLANQASTALASLEDIEKDKAGYQLALEREQERIDQIVQSYTLKAEAYNLIFDYRSAVNVYQKAVKLMEETKMEEDLELADGYNVLGGYFQNLGDYSNTLEYTEKGVSIVENSTSKESIKMADYYHNLAQSYTLIGDYDNALTYQEKDLIICSEILGIYHPRLSNSYNSLALIYQNYKGDSQFALDIMQKAILIEESQSPHDTLKLANLYNNSSIYYQHLGRYSEALDFAMKSLIIQEKFNPENHRISSTYNNISLIYRDMGEYNNAVEYQEKAIALLSRTLEENHPHIATSYNNLGLVYILQENYDKAYEVCQKALTIRQNSLPNDHYGIADSYLGLANVYIRKEKFQKALEKVKDAIAIYEVIVEEDHHKIAEGYNIISAIYYSLEDFEQSSNYQNKAISIIENRIQTGKISDSPTLGKYYSNLSSILVELEKYDEAILYQRKAISIKLKFLSSGHPSVAISYYSLAQIFSEKDNRDSTLVYIEKAYEIWKNKLPSNHSDLKKSISNLAKLYGNEALTLAENVNYKKAAKYLAKAAKFTLLSGNEESGLFFIDKAIQLGFDDLKWLKNEDAFDPIRYNSTFISKLEWLETKNNNQVYNDHLDNLKLSIAILEDKFNLDYPKVIDLYHELFLNYSNLGYEVALGYYEEAIIYFKEKIELRKKNLKYEPFLSSAYIQHFLARSHLDLARYTAQIYTKERIIERYKSALSAQLESIRLQENILEIPDEKLAIAYNNLSSIYQNLEEYEKALDVQLRALEIKEKLAPLNKESISNSYNNIVTLYRDLGYHEKAIEFCEKDVLILKEIFDDDHPYISQAYANLASLYKLIENYNKALKAQQKSFDLLKGKYGDSDFRVRESYYKLIQIQNLLEEGKK